jgi:hypothetical protein
MKSVWGCWLVIVLCSAAATGISYLVTTHGTSPELGNLRHANQTPGLMFYLLLALTVLLIIVPVLFPLFATIDRNIRRNTRRR